MKFTSIPSIFRRARQAQSAWRAAIAGQLLEPLMSKTEKGHLSDHQHADPP